MVCVERRRKNRRRKAFAERVLLSNTLTENYRSKKIKKERHHGLAISQGGTQAME